MKLNYFDENNKTYGSYFFDCLPVSIFMPLFLVLEILITNSDNDLPDYIQNQISNPIGDLSGFIFLIILGCLCLAVWGLNIYLFIKWKEPKYIYAEKLVGTLKKINVERKLFYDQIEVYVSNEKTKYMQKAKVIIALKRPDTCESISKLSERIQKENINIYYYLSSKTGEPMLAGLVE